MCLSTQIPFYVFGQMNDSQELMPEGSRSFRRAKTQWDSTWNRMFSSGQFSQNFRIISSSRGPE